MKVERINEVQIKFVLTKTDLEKRSLDINDLAYGSSKTQELFQDIIETASREFAFNLEDTPLMIEAVPMSKTSITIMLTKVSPDSKKIPPLAESLLKKMENMPNKKAKEKINDDMDDETSIRIPYEGKEKKNKKVDAKMSAQNKCFVYAFNELDEIGEVAKLVKKDKLNSSVYKLKDEYMLIIESIIEKDNKGKNENMHVINRLLSEHGRRAEGKGELVKAYLYEKAEKIIAKDALEILTDLYA